MIDHANMLCESAAPLPPISIAQASTAAVVVPDTLPKELRSWLNQARMFPPVRCSRVAAMVQEYESDEATMLEKYKPVNVKPEFWRTTKDLMLHMNTTKIAVRSLMGVYAGKQTRRVAGAGQYAEQLHRFVNAPNYRRAAPVHFRNAALCGTSFATPYWDEENAELDILLHDAARTRIYSAEGNVKSLQILVEHDRCGRWIRFMTRTHSGILWSGRKPGSMDIVEYRERLPYLLTSIAYGDDRRSCGERYGGSLVPETPGYNRILTNAYYCLGLLIKWQAKSLLTIMSGEKGGKDSLPAKITQINGNTALLLERDAKAEFISPQAKFVEVLEVINSYISFLAVSLGIPKSVFIPQDNASAQSARLEGAPLMSTLRKLATEFEDYERDLVLKCAAFMHIRDEKRVVPMNELREKYEVIINIEPWDYTDDPYSNAQSIALLVEKGIMRLKDAVRKANSHLTEEEIDQFIAEGQEKVNAQVEEKLAQAA